MTSMFDYDDSVNLAYNAKIAGKALVAAKHEVLKKTGDFLFLAHSEKELALRCQMVERDIENVAFTRLASVSDSKAKLVRAVYDEWALRHARCEMCKTAGPEPYAPTPECDNCGRLYSDFSNLKEVAPYKHRCTNGVGCDKGSESENN